MSLSSQKNLSNISVKKAHRIIQSANHIILKLGFKCYVISFSWWAHFKHLISNAGSNNIIEVPPLNNKSIVKKTKDGYELKSNLIENTNYVLLSEKMFQLLINEIGVDLEERDVIAREIVVGKTFSKKAYVEMYPVEQKVKDKNLRAIERIDPFVEDIITQSSNSAIFEFDIKEKQWQKSEIDGTLFIYKRIDAPFYSFMVANRQSLNDFVHPITTSLRLKYQPPHIFMYKPDGMIKSLYIYGEDECKRIYKILLKLSSPLNTTS